MFYYIARTMFYYIEVMSMPDFDSGWIQTDGGVVLQHNLGTTELFIYAMYQTGTGNIEMVTPDRMQWWALDNSTVSVRLMGVSSGEICRILIWKLVNILHNFLFGSDNPS